MSIRDSDIRRAVDWMRAADPQVLITPGKVYRALGKKADCGGCLPHFIDTLRGCDSFEVPMQLRGLRRAVTQGDDHEGRREGYRVSQQGAAK
jgi:bacterioferritin-associated ferredoxin